MNTNLTKSTKKHKSVNPSNDLECEILRLRRQRTQDLLELARQKDIIIQLYARLNQSTSTTLRVAQ